MRPDPPCGASEARSSRPGYDAGRYLRGTPETSAGAYAWPVLTRVNRWLDRHPLVADSTLAAILLVFSLSTLWSGTSEPDASEVVLTVVLTAPLALRRRAPVAVFAGVMLACGAELVLVDEFIAANGGALVALYTLMAHASQRQAAVGLAVALAGSVPFALHFDELGSASVFLTWLVLALHVVLAAALGDRMRGRAREREGLHQRAQLLAAERDQQAAIAAAAERARIARELHDVVAHSLSVVIAQADGGRYGAEQDPRAATAALHTIASTAREAQAEMRRALGVLGERPDDPRRPQPGVDDVDALVARTREAGLAVRLVEEGTRPELGSATGLTVYRVVQEALTNVMKHAGPDATATVLLNWEPGRVTLVVRDDGAGTAGADTDSRGRGLEGMRERAESRGGTLAAGPRAAGGFEVRAVMPTETTRASVGA
jgi:signal transduction histidine kinase